MLVNDRFLRACRKEPLDYTPVWIMRQAGRYMKEYRDLRERVDFLTLCKTPELAAEATLLPIDLLGVDAAIIFSDILIPVEAMGLTVVFTEKKGPVFPEPVKTEEQVRRLIVPDPEEKTPFVMEAMRLVRRDLKDRVPLIGFAGAPYTLATYLVEGETSRNFHQIKRWMYQSPALLQSLIEKLTRTVTLYLRAQIEAGAHAVQLFDTWAGMLSPDAFSEFALPCVRRIIQDLRASVPSNIPIIYFVNGGGTLLEKMVESGADVIGLDWRIDLADAKRRIGGRTALQGNLDPCVLYASPDVIRQQVRKILQKYGRGSGHIFNLGHGILPDTPVEHARALVEAVHEESAAFHGPSS
ncbi:MAG: uroporphyrinogen decarboxylase [Nitrospirae bacterium]|nr:uroporphyrinogen decarboxylase [Nitrospirota bacterium]